MARIIFLFAFLALTTQSCYYLGGKRVRGNGNIETDERSVSAFDEVEVHGAMDVYVTQGDLRPVKIEGDENLLKYIEIHQKGNAIEIRTRPGYNLRPKQKIKVYVTSPGYSRLDVSGACNIYSENKLSGNQPIELEVSGAGDIKVNVDAPKVTAGISGSGSVEMSGETRDFDLRLSGAGKARCYDMKAENTKVGISGAGSAEVYASVNLDAEVSGAGTVKYKGNAGKVNEHVSGAGSVKKAD
jgi:Putative auto-transporter adhesin, head GIN domain